MRTQSTKLKHHEQLQKVDVTTGEITSLPFKVSNMPEGKSLLNYKEFGILNTEVVRRMKPFFSNEELGVIMHMTSLAEFGTNSLKPLNDDMSVRIVGERLSIQKDKVKKIIANLYDKGVYMSIRIHKEEDTTYWVLNPYIFWRGKIKDDSIFSHFEGTAIAKMLK